ncbi:MAG TPA: hypothetical protein V6D47_19265 [Oscillatoriaceae cyanobacterium]
MRKLAHGLFAFAFLLAGCQNVPVNPLAKSGASLDITPTALTEPKVVDWETQRISSAEITQHRQTYFASMAQSRPAADRKVLAYPSQSTNWSSGIALTTYGCAASDYVPNGAAVCLANAGTPQGNKAFFLTHNGTIIRLDKTAPTSTSGSTKYVARSLGHTFSRTSILLSALGSRVYVVADDGTFFILDGLTLATLYTTTLSGGGYGCAPCIDPYGSNTTDTHDEVYVPTNDGNVSMFNVTADSTTTNVAGPTVYDVATGVTPLAGTYKIGAPAIVLDGVIYVGDEAGNFNVVDTRDSTNDASYGLGHPIDSSPALELQDGSYTGLTDAFGNPVNPSNGTPIYAFVNAGASCNWINLEDTSITNSQPLFLNDNSTHTTFGYLLNYNYGKSVTTETLAAQDGGSINTESPDYDLPGTNPGSVDDNSYLMPADTAVHASGSTPKGGPVVSYLRWVGPSTPSAGGLILTATLLLTPAANDVCLVPSLFGTSSYYNSTPSSGYWASNMLTNTDRPALGSSPVGIFNGKVNKSGTVNYKAGKQDQWNVNAAFSTVPNDYSYALALKYTDAGSKVYYPNGPLTGSTSQNKNGSGPYLGVQFDNNPLNADSSPGGSKNDTRPILKLQITNVNLPTPSIETAPIIDSLNKRVYVFYTNALYELDYSNTTAFSDTSTSADYTIFQNSTYGVNSGSTYDSKAYCVANYTVPAVAYDGASLYVLDRYPSPSNTAAPTNFVYSFTKISLPLSSNNSKLVGSAPKWTTALSNAAADYLILDPNSSTPNVFFGMGDGRIYQYDH